MVKKYSEDLNNKIIADWYAGDSRKDIEKRYSVSGGYVSKLVQGENQRIEKRYADAFRRLAIQARKMGLTAVDISETVRLKNGLKKETGMDAEEALEYTLRLAERCKKDGIDLKSLAQDNNSKIEEAKELDSILASKRKETEEAEKRYQDVLIKENMTHEKLEEQHKVNHMLEEYGLSPDGKHIERLVNALANAEAFGYNIKSIVKAMSDKPSLKQENHQLQIRNNHLKRVNDLEMQTMHQQEAKLKKNSEVLNMIYELRRLGFGITELRTLAETVTKVSIDNGLDSHSSVKRLIRDISNGEYDSKVGFSKKIEEIKKLYEEQEANNEKIKLDHARYASSIVAVQALESKGVKISEIIAIKEIIERSGAVGREGDKITEIKNDIITHGSLKSANKEYEKINKEL